MSEEPSPGVVPEWSLADRLRKAREHAALKQSELADHIGIARSSVVNYEAGRYEPSRPVLLSWAMATGVSLNWLAGDYLRPLRARRPVAPARGGVSKARYRHYGLRLVAA